MRNLNFELKQLGDRNRDGSFATQANRAWILSQVADQLWEMGYRQMSAQDLKGRHVNALVEQWHRDELSSGTIKNRMAALRWWAEKVGRSSVIHRENAKYGIQERTFVTNESKAKTLEAEALAKVASPYVHMSLELQAAFGLRREEAIKIQPGWADRGDHVFLKDSWTKGGREREVPITTPEQREVLDRAKAFAGKGSLIPSDRNYVQQLRVYERQCMDAGLSKMHGLRHAYAQARYEVLTGWKSPAAGGPVSKALTPEQKAIDLAARLTISEELGHEREEITANYLGR